MPGGMSMHLFHVWSKWEWPAWSLYQTKQCLTCGKVRKRWLGTYWR